MLPDRQVNKKFIDLWVQRAPFRLERLIHKYPSEILTLSLLKDLINIVEIIVKKYGFFRLTPNMIKVNKGNFLQVWIN